MNRFIHTAWRFAIAVLLVEGSLSLFAQVIRLPGGITIGDPRQANRPAGPANRPERPDPDRVCPKTIEWVGILQKEYPGVDLGHTMSNRVQQMSVPLFADAVFQKEFGVSYPKLSDAERRDFFRMHLIPCTNVRRYGQQMSVLQIFNTPFMPGTAGTGPLAPGQLIPALNRLETSRTMLRADEQFLAGASPTLENYDRVTGLPGQRKDELARVWPSEKAQFEATVKDAVARSASVAVQAQIQTLLAASASPQVAKQLRDAPRTYSALFQAMPPDQRTTLVNKLDDRRGAMLRDLLPPQQARADSFPATRQGLNDGAEWFASYQAVFLDAPVIPEAAALAKSYLTKRKVALVKLAPQFKVEIEDSQDANAVTSMYDEVFRLPYDRETETYKQISAARSARAELLNKRAEHARLAAEEKADKAALQRGEINTSSLKLANLTNAAAFRALYVGDFAHTGMQRTNVVFVDAFDGYLQKFGGACKESLPADKVEMSEPECVRSVERTVTKGYAVLSRAEECVEWGRRPLGVYSDPQAFAAKVKLEGLAQSNGFRDFLSMLKTPDPLASATGQMGNMVASELSLQRDIPQLIAENGCGSKALARLQENLTRFANGDDPIHIAGYSTKATQTPRAQDLDVRGIADDLIQANAAGWFFNHYSGLESAAVDGSLDADGRPRHILATYNQEGITSSGSVDIAFVDGVPSCLYFADDPSNCKPPSPSVVKRYEQGEYRRKSGR